MKKQFSVDFAGSSYPSIYIDNRVEAERAILRMLESKEILAADCETARLPEYSSDPDAALSPYLSEPRLFQFFTGKGACVIDLYKTGKLPLLKDLFESRPSVFHNKSFDCKVLLKHYGIKKMPIECTAIMARLCWCSMYPTYKSASLKDVAYAIFKQDVVKSLGKSDWSVPEITFEQINYAALDAVIQMRVYEKLKEWVEKLGLSKVYKLYSEAQNVICQMELNGISLDKEVHKCNIVNWRQRMADARDELESITGIQVITDQKIGEWLKKNLPEKVLDIWPRTEKNEDRLAVGSDALVNFEYLDVVKPFSKFQKYKKLCTSFGMSLLDHINPATGKFHCSYSVSTVATGRLSCSNFNIQQSPRDPDFRKSIIPSAGYKMVVADYSSVEVRCIAELAKEEKMLEAYEKGFDIYKFTAAHLNSKSMDMVTKLERQGAKALVLGLLYGLGSKKFSFYAKKTFGVEISEENAHIEVQKFRALYKSLRAWQLNQVDKCQANRYMAFTTLGKSRKLTEENYYGASLNMPVQGTCAEIMLLAMIYVHRNLEGTSGRVIACVHDELVCEAKEEDVDKVKDVLNTQMALAYHRILPSGRTLKNLVEASSGSNWSEAK